MENLGTERMLGSISRVIDSFSVRDGVFHIEASTSSMGEGGGCETKTNKEKRFVMYETKGTGLEFKRSKETSSNHSLLCDKGKADWVDGAVRVPLN